MVDIMWAQLIGQLGKGRVRDRFVMGPVFKVGVVYPAAQDKFLTINVLQVGGHLHKMIIWLIRVLIIEGSVATQPACHGHRERILSRALRLERHNTLPDNIEYGSAVVIVAPVRCPGQKLTELKLQTIAHLQCRARHRVMAHSASIVPAGFTGYVQTGHR